MVQGAAVPFGLKEVMLIPLVAGVPSTDTGDFVNLGYARSGAYTIDGTSVNTAGNDEIIATEYFDEMITGTLEEAGMNIASAAFMWGQTPVITGVTPNIVHAVTRDVSIARPHFAIRMKSRSSKGGTYEATILNAQATGGPNMTQQYGTFANGSIPFTATANDGSDLIKLAHYETPPVDPPPGP